MEYLDLFCGIGGFSLGFQNVGYNAVAAFDNWDKAINVYKANFKHPVYEHDLNKWSKPLFKSLGDVELIIGGCPCQDFSIGGAKDETRGRAQLTSKYAEIVILKKPKFFVFENVPNVVNFRTYKEFKNTLDIFGYKLSETILDASYCGVPQSRKRLFLIGEYKGNTSQFLDKIFKGNLHRSQMTLEKYCSWDFYYYYKHPSSYNNPGIHSIKHPCHTIRGTDCNLPSTYKFHHKDASHVFTGLRSMNKKEVSLVQTFPLSFNLLNYSKADTQKMLGNAVPVKLSEYVARSLKEYVGIS